MSERPTEILNMVEEAKKATEPIKLACDPIAAEGFVTVLAGKRSTLKSWLGMGVAYQVHREDSDDERMVAGMRCRKGRGLYVDAESGPRLMVERFKVAGFPLEGFVVADAFNLHLPKGEERLRRILDYAQPTFAVLDSLRRLAPGAREDKSDDMAPIMDSLARLSREFGTAITLLHHQTTKAVAGAPVPDMRGSSAIEDQADMAFVLEHVKGDPERNRRRLRCTGKYRIGAEPAPVWLTMERLAGFLTLSHADPYVCEEAGRDRPRDTYREGVIAATGKARSVRAIADLTGIPKTTVHRLLTDLQAEGVVAMTDDGWVSRPTDAHRESGGGTPRLFGANGQPDDAQEWLAAMGEVEPENDWGE